MGFLDLRERLRELINTVGDDLDRRRRATVLLTMSLAVLVANPIFTTLFFVGGSPYVAAVVVMSGIAPITSLLLLRQGRLRVAGHAFVGIFLLCLQLANFTNGGVLGLGLWWTLMMPIIAAVVLGARQSAIWLVATMAGFLGYGVVQFAGIEVPQEIPLWVQPLVMGFGGAFLAGLLYLFVWQYERSHDHMRCELVDQERETRAAHERVRLVLDNVEQGFCLLDRHGVVQPGVSAVLTEWLGDVGGLRWAEVIGRYHVRGGQLFDLEWSTLLEDFLPAELCLQQMSRQLEVGERTLRLAYTQAAPLDRLIVVVTVVDVTEQLAIEAAEREQRELAAIMRRLAADPSGMFAFLGEIEALLSALGPDEDRTRQLRALHTIKGNTGMFGMLGLSSLCHEIEQAMLDQRRKVQDEDRRRIADQWQAVLATLGPLLDVVDPSALTIPKPAYEYHLDRLSSGDVQTALRQALGWGLEPVDASLTRLGEQAHHLAVRLGKGEIHVEVDAHGLRVDGEVWAPLWSSLVHVLRNAIDHGLEPEEERIAAGKRARGTVTLTADLHATGWTVTIRDDGRGIDWAAIERKARSLGLPTDDLESVLFMDGVSSRETATEISGRGVGMAAVASVVRDHEGTIEIDSARGTGTAFHFRFPRPSRLAVDEPLEQAA